MIRPARAVMRSARSWIFLLLVSACLSGCGTLGGWGESKGSQQPLVSTLAVPEHWQTLSNLDPASANLWQEGKPSDGHDKGQWWTWFHDAKLDQLQQQATGNSPTLQIASARLRLANEGVALAEASSLPRLDLALRGTRSRTSANRPTTGATANSSVQNDVVLQGVVSYELDLWGRQRDEQEAAQASQAQAKADLLNAQLVLSADLGAAYFNLRGVDAEVAVLTQGLQAQTRAADLLRARHEGGIASSLDVAQQQAQIDATRTQLILLQKQRDQLQHALATLTGLTANQFQLEVGSLPDQLPEIPVGLPSDVLQRRPDIAAAERAVAVANSQVGLASKAWFPSIQLSTSGGWESKDIARLLDAPSLIWAVGGVLTQAVFDGGKLRAREQQALAIHDATLAQYRQTVLRAIQEVEDGLSSRVALEAAQRQSQAAIASAQKAHAIAQERYSGGIATYLDVVTAQQNVLNNQRLSAQIRNQQLQNLTYLIKALGGSWQKQDFSSPNLER